MLRFVQACSKSRLYMSRVVQTGSVLDIYGTAQADQIAVVGKTVPVEMPRWMGRSTSMIWRS